MQRLQVARHANRPTFLDIALNITDKFVELHGDRAGLDDPAIVCGLGSIDGISFMLIGHQKGRNTKARSARACPLRPHHSVVWCAASALHWLLRVTRRDAEPLTAAGARHRRTSTATLACRSPTATARRCAS